jgi:hypothetical protein
MNRWQVTKPRSSAIAEEMNKHARRSVATCHANENADYRPWYVGSWRQTRAFRGTPWEIRYKQFRWGKIDVENEKEKKKAERNWRWQPVLRST